MLLKCPVFFFPLGRTAFLRQRQNLDYNYYPVPIQIKDRHGLTAKHVLSVRVCECTTPSECRMTLKGVRDLRPSNVILGRWAILAMVLGSALLLCKCNYLECVCCFFLIFSKYMVVLYINDIYSLQHMCPFRNHAFAIWLGFLSHRRKKPISKSRLNLR